MRVWDVASGAPVGPHIGSARAPHQVRLAPDGRTVVILATDGFVRRFEAETGREVSAVPLGDPARLGALSSDGRFVVTARPDGVVRAWDLAYRARPARPVPRHPLTRCADFSPDGRLLATGGTDGIVRITAARSGNLTVPPLHCGAALSVVSFSPDGQRLFAGTRDGSGRMWDARTGRPLTRVLRHDSRVWFAAFSPDGRSVVAATPRGSVYVWDTAGAGLRTRLRMPGQVHSASLSADARWLGVNYQHGFQIWRLRPGKPVLQWARGWPEWFSGYSPDSRLVLSPGLDGALRFHDATSGREVGQPLWHADPVSQASFSPDGRHLVTCSETSARLWDVVTRRELTPPLRHGVPLDNAAFSPDGRLVVTHSSAGFVRLWDAGTGEPVTPPLQQQPFGGRARFSEDGRSLLIVQEEGRAFIRDVPPADQQRPDLEAVVLALAGQEPNDLRRTAPPERVVAAWKTLEKRKWREVLGSDSDELAWHTEQANEAERARQWSAALSHLDRLVAAYPRDWQFRRRRARANGELHHWEAAARDLDQAVRSGVRDPNTFFERAVAYLAAADHTGYRHAVHEMRLHFERTGEVHGRDLAGWAAALGASRRDDLDAGLRFFRGRVAADEREASSDQGTIGALLYRQGRYGEAAAVLEKVVGPQRGGEVADRVFLGMTWNRLGRRVEARQLLDHATREGRAKLHNDELGSQDWAGRAELTALLREAAAGATGLQPAKGDARVGHE